MSPLESARAYLAAGLSVIPVRADGTKAPALDAGHDVLNRRRHATADECVKWWANGRRGIAVLGGAVSGNAECLDFEDADLAIAWINLVSADIPDVLERICVVRTPRPGRHVWYRTSTATPGHKLALDERGHTLIETRAEGQYALVPGTPAACHASGKPYEHEDGRPLTDLAVFTDSEHALLLDAARALTRRPEVPAVQLPEEAGERPGDAYNRRGPDWADLLIPAGWRCVRTDGAVRHWQRPGKEGKGASATTGAVRAGDGTELFYVFSSNAPLPTGAYSRFRLYAALHHQGDLRAAAGALADQGFGARPSRPASQGTSRGDGGDETVRASDEPRPLVPHPRKLAATARPKVPDRFTASELMKLVLPPVRWAVPGLVAEGLAILAGVPKAGKSWLALHIALGVAAGDGVLGGAPVEAGPVLYLALEDTQRRLQKRLTRLNADATRLTSLHFRLRGTPFDTKGLVALQAEVRDLRPRLVVIDTLAKVRPALSRREESNAYQSDYGFVAGIKRLADDYDAPIICVHHTSKAPRADPVAEVSGTLGLSGAADSIIVMKRDRHKKEATLFITGRDVDEQELAITADIKGGIWRKLGDATEHRLSRERQDILTLLTGRPGLRPKEIATALGRSNDSVRYLLGQMSDDGQVRADGLHRYFVAKPSQPSHPHSPEQDNTGQ